MEQMFQDSQDSEGLAAAVSGMFWLCGDDTGGAGVFWLEVWWG